MKRPAHILPLIVLSQFAGTSLWFASNAILPQIQSKLGLASTNPGTITSFIQFGFISGTLLFAILAIADRFKPSQVFFISSLLASAANLCILWLVNDMDSLLLFRFLTGFFLAGIYPVGMKIAADWYEKGLGTALGWLVGALVLGTAFPHLLKGSLHTMPWQNVIWFTSIFASAGGLLMFLFVKEGPYRKRAQSFQLKNIAAIFRLKDFRAASFGYFGHMWEIYTFWAFVPVILTWNKNAGALNISLWSFIIIGVGFLSCIAGGYISQKIGSAKVAFYSLFISGCCCFLSFLLPSLPVSIFLFFLLLWGITVSPDSPQFSALVAQTAPAEYKGTALTMVTCIGFAITIGSLQLINFIIAQTTSPERNKIFIFLGPGPLIGLLFLYRLLRKK